MKRSRCFDGVPTSQIDRFPQGRVYSGTDSDLRGQEVLVAVGMSVTRRRQIQRLDTVRFCGWAEYWTHTGSNGGAVNGSDSYLHIYDIDTDTWSGTPALQSSGVVPGLRSGAFDIWGVALTSDPIRRQLFVIGGEANRQVYVFNVPVLFQNSAEH